MDGIGSVGSRILLMNPFYPEQVLIEVNRVFPLFLPTAGRFLF